MNAFRSGLSANSCWNSGTAEPSRQAGGQDDRAALLDDRQRAGQALDRLIPGRVERIAGAAGDHDVQRLARPAP